MGSKANSFYDLSSTSIDGATYADESARYATIWDVDESDAAYYPPCPEGLEEHGPNWRPPQSLRVKVMGGKVAPDFLFLPNSFLIRRELLDELSALGLTGLSERPFEVTNPKRMEALGVDYAFAYVEGRAHVHPSSGVRLAYRCRLCGKERFTSWRPGKLAVDMERYDGTDFFRIVEAPGMEFCSQRAAQALIDRRVKGAVLTPMASISPLATSPWGRFGKRFKFNELSTGFRLWRI